MTKFPTRKWTFSMIGLTMLLALVVLPASFVSPARAASDNTNLIQQILSIVQNIQATLTGTGGSLSSLQSDVTAIKTKTDNLPQDTDAKLTTLHQSVDDSGPLNRMCMKAFNLGISETGEVTCSSTGPYLLHIHADGIDAVVDATLGQTTLFADRVGRASVVVGGNANQAITIRGSVGSQTNPNAYVDVLITMQTTASTVVGCN